MPYKSKAAELLRCAMGALACLVVLQLSSHAGELTREGPDAEGNSLYVKVLFDAPIRGSALKAGDTLEGKLSEAVYRGDREVFPAGSRVRLTVDRLERRRRAANDHWPWVIKAFVPRHDNHPVFSAAIVTLPDGREVTLKVSLISLKDKRDVQVQWRTKSGDSREASPAGASTSTSNRPSSQEKNRPRSPTAGTTATFEAVEPAGADAKRGAAQQSRDGAAYLSEQARVEAGTQARVILLGDVSASKSRSGDLIAARLIEPIKLGSTVLLPQGSVFEGQVVKVTPPRVLSRSGSLLLAFDRVTAPGGASVPVAASIIGVELDAESHTRIDSEGNLSGGRPGKAWMLINLGASAGIAKAADDATELVAGLLISTATEASTAGLARIVGACVSGVFLVTRHGRDVLLPRFTEMRIVLDKALVIHGPQSGQASPSVRIAP